MSLESLAPTSARSSSSSSSRRMSYSDLAGAAVDPPDAVRRRAHAGLRRSRPHPARSTSSSAAGWRTSCSGNSRMSAPGRTSCWLPRPPARGRRRWPSSCVPLRERPVPAARRGGAAPVRKPRRDGAAAGRGGRVRRLAGHRFAARRRGASRGVRRSRRLARSVADRARRRGRGRGQGRPGRAAATRRRPRPPRRRRWPKFPCAR
jgi:hypothetical protein